MPTTEQTLTSEAIRQAFFSFFEEKGHTIVPSASLVPQADPTLLFTNAGMNQFKDVFLGEGTRDYDRAADTQKCLRVSGKHNDLEEVGHDTYHHTFFEMLGNWSFGDYFKQEAIAWAWELLVEEWGLAPDRLYATVHAGDDALGLDADDEAAGFWRSETTLTDEQILFEPSKDNFWMMGDTGPCGPCSEVHIDLRPEAERQETPGRELVNKDHPQVMEIWNLVFIQYDAQADGSLKALPAQHVDTGMGFERLVAVLQGKSSTYDTDLFGPLLQSACDLSPRGEIKSYDDLAVDDPEEKERIRVALRVVADHVRTVAFAIADGVTPGNEGRAYVIRRIARRAVRYGYQTLGLREPFLHKLAAPLREKMAEAFPELEEQEDYIVRVMRAEEESFLETLGTGIAFFERVAPYVERLAAEEEVGANGVLDEVASDLKQDRQTLDLLQKAYGADEPKAIAGPLSQAAARREVPGEVAFLLHDTYGFPIDLTRLMAREEGLGVDMARYDALMKEQKDRARAASSFSTGSTDGADWQTISEGDAAFVGYDELEVDDAAIRAVRTLTDEDGTERAEIVLDRTPFYAESGGQVGDTGLLHVGDEALEVLDTQKEGSRTIHRVDHLPMDLDAPVHAAVDADRRRRIQQHHSVTHLLHAVLRDELGTHVQQKGSLVAPGRLRFDFSHFERVDPGQLRAIEDRVNEAIQANVPRQEERDVPIEEARARGAMMLFGEKYGDRVRMITFDPEFSVELCGGTHVGATGEIGLFRFLSEGSVASGVRRVEAVAGPEALAHARAEQDALAQVRRALGPSAQRPAHEEVADLLAENERLKSELESAQQDRLAGQLAGFIDSAQTVDGLRLVTGRFDGVEMDALQTLGQTLRDRLAGGSVGVLGSTAPEGEKVYVVATVADDVLSETNLQAGKLVGALGKKLGGGGGGRPTLAAAGGRSPEKLDEVLAAVPDLIREMAGKN